MRIKNKGFTLIELLVVVAIIVIVLGLIAGAISGRVNSHSQEKAVELLEQDGYHDIVIEGYKPFAGSEDDYYKIGFHAVNRDGNPVTGVVTGSDYKGWTIRRY